MFSAATESKATKYGLEKATTATQQVQLTCYPCCSPLFPLPPGKKVSYIRALFVDYNSTFNMATPHKLTHKLSTLGPHPTLCDWLLGFLTRRPQSGLVMGLQLALSQTLALHRDVSSAPSSTPCSPTTVLLSTKTTP